MNVAVADRPADAPCRGHPLAECPIDLERPKVVAEQVPPIGLELVRAPRDYDDRKASFVGIVPNPRRSRENSADSFSCRKACQYAR
jgi:hypothetical protein